MVKRLFVFIFILSLMLASLPPAGARANDPVVQALTSETPVALYDPNNIAPADNPLSPTDQPAPLTPHDSLTTIEGINFEENGALNLSYFIPPDPSGAVGPSHVVSVVNASIEWHTKAGVQQKSVRLGSNGSVVGSFFETLNPANNLFDPKVIYDQYNGRFLVIALERTASASRALIAVSQDSDPNNGWYFKEINTTENIGGSDCWGDYPGFAIDGQAVYLTLNMFSFSTSALCAVRLWIMDKSSFYSDGALTSTKHNPYAGGGVATTTQPAHMFGTAPSTPGVPGATSAFLVAYSGLTNGTDLFLQVVRVDDPLGTPTFNLQQINFGAKAGIDDVTAYSALPGAPQLGTVNTVNTNDRRALNAVWRDNALWVTFEGIPSTGTDAGDVTAHWIKVNTSTLATLSIADQGNVGAEDIATDAFVFFPSIMVDASGNMAMGFAVSASTIYPGAYYTGRLASDAAGTVRATKTVAAGLDYYYRVFTGTRNRWGDYTGIALDPVNERFFWVFNEYAMARGSASGGDGRWATRWAAFAMDVPTAYVDDSWIGGTFGVDPDGAGAATAFGMDAFASIQNGVNNVSPGGSVNVAAGTYAENLTISQDVTINGPAAPGTAAATLSSATATSPLTVSGGTVTVKGLTISAPSAAAVSVSGGSLTMYANNITSYASTTNVTGGSLSAVHNWWGEASRAPDASLPTGLTAGDWAARLGAPVFSWADGSNSASLGSATLTGGTGTALIVSFGRPASAAEAPFGNGVSGHVDQTCSDFYDFSVRSGAAGTWSLSIPVDDTVGCNATTLATDKVYMITSIASCTPAGNTACWGPAAGVTHGAHDLTVSGLSAASLGGTHFVAGDPTGADPTSLALVTLVSRLPAQTAALTIAALLSAILGAALWRRKSTAG